ncbi:MAG: hypothetical protein KDI31_07810 [Pseudomonadales bacterium]|nr:hypothetical protein [Pseudomonadales bacterium]
MPESGPGPAALTDLLGRIEQAIGEGELADAVSLSRMVNSQLRARCGESLDPADLETSDARVRLLLGRTATLRSELMKKLSSSARRRDAARAYQITTQPLPILSPYRHTDDGNLTTRQPGLYFLRTEPAEARHERPSGAHRHPR